MLIILNFLAFAEMVGINVYANLKRLGGASTGEISAAYPNIFTPAGFTFAIWGAVYGLLLIYLIRTFFSSRARETADRIGPWFIISCIFNTGWIFCWHFRMIPLSMAAMMGLFVSLVILRGRTEDAAFADRAGFDLYAGWISLAMAANFIAALVSAGADGFGSLAQVLSFGILLIAGILMMGTVLVERSWVFGIAGLWGMAGILYRHLAPNQLAGRYPWIIGALMVGLIFVSFGVVTVLRDTNKKTKMQPALPPLNS